MSNMLVSASLIIYFSVLHHCKFYIYLCFGLLVGATWRRHLGMWEIWMASNCLLVSCSPKANLYIRLFTMHTHGEALRGTLACSGDTFITTSEHVHIHTHTHMTHTAHTGSCLERIFHTQQNHSHTHESPLYFCSLSVPHIVNWASESCIKHTHTHVPVTHLVALTALLSHCCSLGMWPRVQQQGPSAPGWDRRAVLHQQKASFSLSAFLLCLIWFSPPGTDGDKQKTLLYENPNGVCEKSVSASEVVCMCVESVYWQRGWE